MNKKFIYLFLPVLILCAVSLACGSVQVGVVTPTGETAVTPAVDIKEPETENIDSEVEQEPLQETTVSEDLDEDFSHLWIEYWDPKYGYGVALPSHWEVHPSGIQWENSVMTTNSYEGEFFLQNAIRGHWIDGGPPEGAIWLEFAGYEGVNPEQATDVAVNQFLTERGGTIILSIDENTIGDKQVYIVKQADKDGPDANTWDSYVLRVQPEVIIMVQAKPYETIYSQDTQMILESFSYSKENPIVKPTKAPFPPFELTNEVGVYPTATGVIAWRGHIASLPEGSEFDDKVVLFPEGAGDVGVKGWTPEIEEEIVSLRDASGPGEWIYMWGNLFCNYADYNNCRLAVERLEYEGSFSGESVFINGWVGTVKSDPDSGAGRYIFELAEPFPLWYTLSVKADDPKNQMVKLADSNTQVKIWGELYLDPLDSNGAQIVVDEFDPPGPRALPSSSSCESGYMGSVAEAIEVIEYNLEIGNYYPFSYLIGNPFVIGYWMSEAVSIPRGEAYEMLVDDLLPSPDEQVVISDTSQFPDLMGINLNSMWGPDVDVAANLYIKGWGREGNGEVIAIIGRCTQGDLNAYFWYGILNLPGTDS